MNKTFCDICGKELKVGNLIGAFIKIIKNISLGKRDMRSQLVEKKSDLCEGCADKVVDFLEELRKEKK